MIDSANTLPSHDPGSISINSADRVNISGRAGVSINGMNGIQTTASSYESIVSESAILKVSGNNTIDVSGIMLQNSSGQMRFISSSGIVLSSGKSKIELLPDGNIMITGDNINLESSASICQKSKKIKLN